ncbi:Retrovirus-related Pol polyprotein from transposon RE1 [Senna tora]|uniref:Retrovirus-related Pol polyprotein from transposon RE1 n=1 Tax=Senna tora TaxID=362788 RepID=A0A834SRC0_9FABA|nr:Retrovirus-related Pol polyprotein from transposon RE1 [Senna tora]
MTSSSLSASASTTPSPNTYSLFSGYSPIKLDRNNYLLWESMVLPLIKGNHLESHVDAQSALLAFESRLELMNQRSWRGGSRGGRRGGGGNHNGGNPPQCQLCGKFGHTASICYHSFDRNFQPNSSTSYMDSGGATHHVASYTDQLENFTCTGARTSSLRTRHFRFLWKTQGGAANGAGSEY